MLDPDAPTVAAPDPELVQDDDRELVELQRKRARLEHQRDVAELARRRCARGRSCPGREGVNAANGTVVELGAQLTTETGLCDRCTTVAARAIRALPGDFVRLYAALSAGGSAGDGDKVSGTRDAPIPIRAGTRDLAHRIVTTAVTWAEPLAESSNSAWDVRALARELADGTVIYRRSRPHVALAGAVRILAANVCALLVLPAMPVLSWAPDGIDHAYLPQTGLDGALEFTELHRLTDIHLGLDHLQHRLPAPCPRCEGMTLVRDNGADTVRCTRGCVTWPESDYQRLTLVLADDLQTA